MPFDPAAVFGKVRAPVKSDDQRLHVPEHDRAIARSREWAAWTSFHSGRATAKRPAPKARIRSRSRSLELDEEKREVVPPPDLVRALKKSPPAWDRWQKSSFSHQKEHVDAVEGAKKPETRERRIAAAVAMLVKTKPKK